MVGGEAGPAIYPHMMVPRLGSDCIVQLDAARSSSRSTEGCEENRKEPPELSRLPRNQITKDIAMDPSYVVEAIACAFLLSRSARQSTV